VRETPVIDLMQDAFYSRANRTRRGWEGASMSENQTTMAPRAEGQVPEFRDITEKSYEGLALTRH
jgi:hypothetical protein